MKTGSLAKFLVIISLLFLASCKTPDEQGSQVKNDQPDASPPRLYELYGTIPQGYSISAAFQTTPRDKSKSCRTVPAPGGYTSRIAETLTIGTVTTSTALIGGFKHLSQSNRPDGKADYRIVMNLNNPTTNYRRECEPYILMLRFTLLEQENLSDRKDLFRMFAVGFGTKTQPAESGMECRGMECKFFGENDLRNMAEHAEVYRLIPGTYRFDVDYIP